MPPQKKKHKKLYNWVKKSTTKNPNKTPRNKQTPLKQRAKAKKPSNKNNKNPHKGENYYIHPK